MSWFEKGQAVRVDGIGRQRMWAVVEEDLGQALRVWLIDYGQVVRSTLSVHAHVITEEPGVNGLGDTLVWLAKNVRRTLPVSHAKDDQRVMGELVLFAHYTTEWQEALGFLTDPSELTRVLLALEAGESAYEERTRRLEAVRSRIAA